MPRQTPSTVPVPRRQLPAIPETWQRILDFMGLQKNGAATTDQIKNALGLQTDARHTLRRMVQRGLIQRVEPGVYRLAQEVTL